MVEEIKILPERLIQMRLDNKWTQRELAERLGMKEPQVWKYENTKYQSASLKIVMRIARVLESK